MGAVRIIGGRFKRTPLAVQDREGLRPTPDRVRETVFDWLMHLSGGTIEDLTVLDMFAGSGAMGLEAASRGARRVVCTELNRKSAAQIRAVVEKLGAAGTVNVVCGDVFSYVGSTNETFDIVFIDPPFAESCRLRRSRQSGPDSRTRRLSTWKATGRSVKKSFRIKDLPRCAGAVRGLSFICLHRKISVKIHNLVF